MVEPNQPRQNGGSKGEGNSEGNTLTREQLVKQIRRFRLAESDMEQVGAAAVALQDAGWGALARALETAVAVCYARPFTRGTNLSRTKWAPREPDARRLHFRLLDLRRKLYAHTDPDTDARRIVDFGTILRDDEAVSSRMYGEQYRELRRDLLPTIVALAREREGVFKAEADEREFQLGRRRPDPSDSGWNIGGENG